MKSRRRSLVWRGADAGFICGRKYETWHDDEFLSPLSGHGQITWLLQNAAFLMRFCRKSLYLKKYWMYLNEISHVASPLGGGHYPRDKF